MKQDVVIDRHAEMPRHLMGEHFVVPNLHCIIGYYGTMSGKPIAVIVGTGKAGDRVFHYGDPANPNEPFKDATAEMIAAVRAYGLQDGKPDIAEAE